ncbi:MAG: hypothetical protein Q9181_008135, partial [Wetmoreana brouardii]
AAGGSDRYKWEQRHEEESLQNAELLASGVQDLPLSDLLPEEDRLDAAAEEYHKQFQAYEAAENTDGTPPDPTKEPSVREIAASFYLHHKTLGRRINGGKSRKEAHQHRQRLTKAEEKALVRWITYLAA